MTSSSRSILRELVTTKYVNNEEKNEEDQLETVRGGFTALQPESSRGKEDIIESREDLVVLAEDESYQMFHRVDETPKLVAKRKSIAQSLVYDEAVDVLRKLKSTETGELLNERYEFMAQKWIHSTRNSEKALVEYVFLNPNRRPYYFTMQCRKIATEDLADLMLKSLLSEPRATRQCLARIAIKTPTDMPFGVLLDIIEKLSLENDGFQLTDQLITATLRGIVGGKTVTHRLKTTNYKEYAVLEPVLDHLGLQISSDASITCSIKGKRHVQMRVMYTNKPKLRNSDSRNRYIELEQTVRSMDRRVLIAEEKNITIEYETNDKMIPLKEGLEPVGDLITFLNTGELDDEVED